MCLSAVGHDNDTGAHWLYDATTGRTPSPRAVPTTTLRIANSTSHNGMHGGSGSSRSDGAASWSRRRSDPPLDGGRVRVA
jgi:hypothetical protein